MILKNSYLSLDKLLSKCSLCFHEFVQTLYENTQSETHISEDAQKFKTYIDTNLSENISINTLCDLVYKSPSQTIRIFKKYFGITPYEYHMKNRIAKAISMIGGSNMPIREIAYSLGFSDEHYFSSVFKKKTGKKPSYFRHQKR